jgi:type VI secretion system protein VasG
LPDKAISVLDTACARVAVSQHATPAEVEDIERRKASLLIEQGIIDREAEIGIEVAQRRAEVEAALDAAETELAAATARWEAEKALVENSGASGRAARRRGRGGRHLRDGRPAAGAGRGTGG